MVVTDNVSKSGDDTNKHTDIGSSFELNLSFGDTLYLHPNDTSGSPIVTIEFTGTDNYKMWSIAMTFALINHNKLRFIDGSCKKDNNNLALVNQWDMCNFDLKDTYDKFDGYVVFNLHKNINSLTQNGAFVAEYYNNTNSLCKQFDAMVSLSPFTCEAAKHFEKHNQFIKLMQFLMGLNERCFKLVGYPAGYVKKNYNANTRPISSNNASASTDVHSTNVSSNNATTSNSH
nr:hypothetical protein [Tanacetum cinerariifolium]